MGIEIIAIVAFGMAMVHGCLWSMAQRRKAAQAAYDEISNEVRRERSTMGRY